MKEIWKSVEGYDDMYQVSNLGRVRTFKSNRSCDSHIMSVRKSKRGYIRVTLYNGAPKHHTVHRLVAQAFIPNPDNKPEVNHIDGNKNNNNVDNLEWVTRSENMTHAYSNGLRKPMFVINNGKIIRSGSKLLQSDVDDMRSKYKTGNYSMYTLSKEYNVSKTMVSKIINGKSWV